VGIVPGEFRSFGVADLHELLLFLFAVEGLPILLDNVLRVTVKNFEGGTRLGQGRNFGLEFRKILLQSVEERKKLWIADGIILLEN